MRTVFISGSYDILNAGHVRSFSWLKGKYPDSQLIVGLNTDRLISELKHGQPIIPFDQRKEILEAVRSIDLVVPVNDKDHFWYVDELGVDVYATVAEWVERQQPTIQWLESHGGEVVVTPYFPGDGITMSSSKIRAKIRAMK